MEYSSLLVMVTAFRNIISFGISFGVYGFIDLQGFLGTFGILGAIVGIIGLGIIPVWSKCLTALATFMLTGSSLW
jgi:hypothetical protein